MLRAVAAIVRHVAELDVMPMFRQLRPEDIAAKDTPGDPDDIVTITDKAAERRLIEDLTGIVPGAVFIGEEAVCENPGLVGALSRPAPAWLIDPIDGTKNFAKGSPNFGIMLALVEDDVTRASWIALPALDTLIVSERGAGTSLNDMRVDTSRRHPSRLRGTVHARLMPEQTAQHVRHRLEHHYTACPSTGSAATEYAGILQDDKDFVIYYRLLPWDHAAGALALVEAGGAAIHSDGSEYSPLSNDQVTIFAASPHIASAVRELLS